ncbi:hypothetical protein SCUCBS95973_001316 [Sporothrix curviconia]|uniref:Uncharacterized protein n=1 Tax=Sporothrix curviconia TaxID=1260050 RepID=A0ABP0AXL2_9PEZI
MAQTRLFASWNEPLVPLTDKQLQAAADSLEYANAHELFLALETDDHLQYHHSVAADEQRRIPAVERSLAENHLPALVIPSTKVDELWTVPRRVASVLETVCRALDDDELKVCEEAVVNDGVGLAGSRRPAHLKIEPPLLHTDPDADCAELQRCGDAARSCGEECVRQHGISHNTSEEDDLFMIPRDAAEYAAQLEENIRTETMTVSEQAIRSLVSLMSSMEWTEKDQAVFWDEQLTVPTHC